MTAALIIGSTVCDVMIYLDRLVVRRRCILITNNGLWEVVHLMSSIFFIFVATLPVCLACWFWMYGDFIRES